MNLHPSLLLTDLYQLNMMEAYHRAGMTGEAVFEFFVRELPERRGFLMAGGLEQALDFLETLRFTPDEIAWLAERGTYEPEFLERLARLRFTGDVHAMAEGTVFFANEPILRVTAPIIEAQLVETRLINLLHFQTLVASKAARMVLAAPGKGLVDFGLRRAHGAEAGLLAARASYMAGFAATATVLAGRLFGVPITGTVAHSFIQAHDDEARAFEDFARACPENVVLLLDTYDTLAGARKAIPVIKKLAGDGIQVRGVRLDSGDLGELARRVRGILDGAGCGNVKIFASGGLDEDALARLASAPIDGFGVGTSLTTSSDAPGLDCAYKLQEYAGIPRRKLSAHKETWPGRKQVYRHYGGDERMDHDVLTVEGDAREGEPLIRQVMAKGKRIGDAPTLEEIRAHAADELARLPEELRRMRPGARYPVEVAPALKALAHEADRAREATAESKSA